ncbi:MAG TPA: hypothetical protein VFE53_19575 [Mucilaginibacter sp.]|jgi:hypothetical protein|nr:hypothetical protein [Mucilaginibacter sp.]
MNNAGSTYLNKLKVAKWLLAIAVLFFVAKPFVGFSLDRSNSIAPASILIKSFTKRKHEYVENSTFDAKTIQRQLANPVIMSLISFSCFLSIIFPLVVQTAFDVSDRFIRHIKFSLFPSSDTWLRDGQLII